MYLNLRNAREYIEKLLWIRTKEGDETRLVMKPAQRKLYEAVKQQVEAGKPVRIIVLKARQMGFSTLISGLIFHACATQENRNALLVAHVADATANLHQMHLRFFDRLPPRLRPMRAASNVMGIVFANPSKDPAERAREPGLRSRIRCATAGGKGVGRSDTLQYVHASEYAFWPDGINTKSDTLLGILQAVPALPGTMVFLESTAKGFDDFHKRWEDAVSGRSDFVPLFFSWAEEPGYRRAVEPGTVWSAEEREMMTRYGLEPEQMAWRRWCIANNCGGDLDKFRQEYPLTPEEAFVASGACWFNMKIITARLREIEEGEGTAPHPVLRTTFSRGAGEGSAGDEGRDGGRVRGRFRYEKTWDASLQKTVLSGIRFEEREDGPVTIWEQPKERTPYVIGGDTAGEGPDWFSAYVIDNTTAAMCARVYMQSDEAEYTAQVYCLGRHYNSALIGLEVNFSTYPTHTLQDWNYPRLYVRQTEDSFAHLPIESYGWRTDPVTRPAMLAELRETVEAHPEIIRDAQLLREMLVFVKDKTGRPAALTGEHDDLVMGYGITLRIRNQQSAVLAAPTGTKGRYTKDMLEDWNAAKPSERAALEAQWGKPY